MTRTRVLTEALRRLCWRCKKARALDTGLLMTLRDPVFGLISAEKRGKGAKKHVAGRKAGQAVDEGECISRESHLNRDMGLPARTCVRDKDWRWMSTWVGICGARANIDLP